MSQIYKPLNHSNDEIRLLLVLPSAAYFEPFRCEVKTFCLADAPRFMALSYEWGEEEGTSKNIITIGCHNRGIPLFLILDSVGFQWCFDSLFRYSMLFKVKDSTICK
jgi:hypothetical protein